MSSFNYEKIGIKSQQIIFKNRESRFNYQILYFKCVN